MCLFFIVTCFIRAWRNFLHNVSNLAAGEYRLSLYLWIPDFHCSLHGGYSHSRVKGMADSSC